MSIVSYVGDTFNSFGFTDAVNSFVNPACQSDQPDEEAACEKRVLGVAATVGLVAAAGTIYYLTRAPKEYNEKKAIREFLELKKDFVVTDANFSWVSKEVQAKATPEKVNAVARIYQAVAMKARSKGETYGDDPGLIVQMGQQALDISAGNCDQCAAAVIAHIATIPNWKSRIELINAKVAANDEIGHAYVLVGRKEEGEIRKPGTWGDQAYIIDLWLQNLTGEDGIIEGKGFQTHVDSFGGRLTVVKEFTPETFQEIAARPKDTEKEELEARMRMKSNGMGPKSDEAEHDLSEPRRETKAELAARMRKLSAAGRGTGIYS